MLRRDDSSWLSDHFRSWKKLWINVALPKSANPTRLTSLSRPARQSTAFRSREWAGENPIRRRQRDRTVAATAAKDSTSPKIDVQPGENTVNNVARKIIWESSVDRRRTTHVHDLEAHQSANNV